MLNVYLPIHLLQKPPRFVGKYAVPLSISDRTLKFSHLGRGYTFWKPVPSTCRGSKHTSFPFRRPCTRYGVISFIYLAGVHFVGIDFQKMGCQGLWQNEDFFFEHYVFVLYVFTPEKLGKMRGDGSSTFTFFFCLKPVLSHHKIFWRSLGQIHWGIILKPS